MERSFNTLVDDLLWPTTEVTRAIAAVAKGDLSQTMPLDVAGRPLEGEFLRSASIVNTMIQQLTASFTSEVTRVAREVGTEGKLGGQAQAREVSGVWKDLTDKRQLDGEQPDRPGAQHRRGHDRRRERRPVSRKITVDVRGEILQLKEAINTMVDQLRSFASEVTRVAREVGTEGKLGGRADRAGRRRHLEGPDRQRQRDGGNLTAQVRNIAEVTTAVARGDLSRKITADVRGEILQLKDTINTMVDQLNGFAAEVTRVAREVGTEGALGGQAHVPGVAGTWKDLTDNVNSMASNLTAQVRNIAEVDDGRRARRPVAQDHGRRERRNPRAEADRQHDGGPAERLRRGGDARRARSGHRGKLGGQAARTGRRRHLEGPDRQRELDGRQPHGAGVETSPR